MHGLDCRREGKDVGSEFGKIEPQSTSSFGQGWRLSGWVIRPITCRDLFRFTGNQLYMDRHSLRDFDSKAMPKAHLRLGSDRQSLNFTRVACNSFSMAEESATSRGSEQGMSGLRRFRIAAL